MKKSRISSGVVFLVATLLIARSVLGQSGCNGGFVTGGGFIPSSDGTPGDKANFGFNAKQCDTSQPVKGQFEYHDATATNFQPGGVLLQGEVTGLETCTSGPFTVACIVCYEAFGSCSSCGSGTCCSLPPNAYQIGLSYVSQNSSFPGSGAADVCVIDNGQGSKSLDDAAAIFIPNGPFSGYENDGLAEGNIKAHACK